MRWRILALLFVARIAMGFQFQTLASVGDNLVVAFGLDYAGVGLLIGVFMAPGLVLAMPAGFSGRYVSDRVLAGLGLCALALGGIVSAAAMDSWTIGLGRVVSGAGFLFSTLYFTKMAADWFVGREIATAMSILVMSWPFGIAMGQVGHAWLAEAYGWRVPFQVASAYCILASLAVLVFYRPPPGLPNATPGAAARLTAYEWRLVILAAIAWATFNGGYVVYLAFGPKVLEAMGQSAIGAAGIISVGSWVMILSGALCGQIADRFGRRDLILAVCMAGAVIALVLLNIPQAGLAASLLFGLVGMAPAGVIMALTGEAMRPEQRAFGMGVFFTVYYAIMLVTPPIAGAIFDATGRAGGPIMFGAVLFAGVLAATLAFRHAKSVGPVPIPRQV
ncbi:CynX/NimT family MFS transporter [Roseomonas sp. HF4]|uniref:MFS transporter n=1 Tax=Roseomonas sp. HF4 TaxID=2562313 RepID=UPI0010C087A5|nr:MFS transporter [Roseomonas sp. HF4]